MATLKEKAGNLRYPRTKILFNNVNAGNIANLIKVIPAASNGLGTGKLLSLPSEGISISQFERYEIEVRQGRAGTVRKSILTIGAPNACEACSFEYGFAVRRKNFKKLEYVRPNQWVTNSYYNVLSNPNAIDLNTGMFTPAILALINERLVNDVNGHVGYHPDGGPVVKAGRVFKIERNDTAAFNVTLTVGGVPTSVSHATMANFIQLLRNATTAVTWAWNVGDVAYVGIYSNATIASGAANTTVTRDNTMIALEGLYVNPSFEVVNPKGFELTTTIVVNGTQPYLDGVHVFDKFFASKHQGALSHWTYLDQPADVIYNKRVIMVETTTAAIHGASHEDGYLHIYEFYYPASSEALVADLFGTTINRFPLSNL